MSDWRLVKLHHVGDNDPATHNLWSVMEEMEVPGLLHDPPRVHLDEDQRRLLAARAVRDLLEEYWAAHFLKAITDVLMYGGAAPSEDWANTMAANIYGELAYRIWNYGNHKVNEYIAIFGGDE